MANDRKRLLSKAIYEFEDIAGHGCVVESRERPRRIAKPP
jgi:hypothetical protein